MQLQYLPDLQLISATDTIISEFAADTTLYESVEMTTTLTCGSPIVIEYLSTDISNNINLFYLEGEQFMITAAAFGPTPYADGIHRVDIKFKNPNEFVRIYNCIFIDTTFKCRLASLLSSLLDEDFASETAHLLHYSLVNGSNCGCECDEMCITFNYLKTILDNQPTKVTDCGCK